MNKPKIFIFAAVVLASTGVTSGVEAQQPPAQPAAPQLPQVRSAGLCVFPSRETS